MTYYNTIQYIDINQEPPTCDICWLEIGGLILTNLGIYFLNLTQTIDVQFLMMPPNALGNNILFGFLNITCYHVQIMQKVSQIFGRQKIENDKIRQNPSLVFWFLFVYLEGEEKNECNFV